MNKLLRFSAAGVILLMLGFSTLVAQEVVYTAGPTTLSGSGGSNGGFAWGDVNGDGYLDIYIPPNVIMLNGVTSFAAAASTKTANIRVDYDIVGATLADIDGDSDLDLWSTNEAAPKTGLYYDSLGVFVRATIDSAGAGVNTFTGIALADIDHSNYLTAAWANFSGSKTAYSDGLVFQGGLGIVLLKKGASGFTNLGKGATGTPAIDTSLSFEPWQMHFMDANNDKYPDLFVTSMRHGYSRVDLQNDTVGARKGCVFYVNDGTGKFVVPNATTLGRPIYNTDSIRVTYNGDSTHQYYTPYGHVVADTGVVVDDTVRHFNAIGSTWGDLNNDGNADVILIGLSADNVDGNTGFYTTTAGTKTTQHHGIGFVVVLYGKGDGSFTFKWNGTNYVSHGLPQANNIRAWEVGDYNNDGLPDLFMSPNFSTGRMFRGNGNGTFTEVSTQIYLSGGGARAGGFIDYNNDGYLDVYQYTGSSSQLQKNSGNSNHWIAFTPVGTGFNKSAIGARFTLYTQGGTWKQTRVIKAEGNANGGQQLRAHFGIGINTSIDSVVVWWPDGTTKTYTGLAVDKYWTVKYGSDVPSAPALVYPANAAVSVAKVDTLKWNPGTSAVDYKVQVSMDPTFAKTALLAVDATVSNTNYAFSLGAATKYYWRVAAINGGFMSDYTAANNFTTAGVAAATVPTQLSPAGQATNQPASLTLKVGKTSDASRYHWQVSTLPTFTAFSVSDSTADTTLTAQFVGGQTYYWRVRGLNDLGASVFSGVDTFTVMTPPARTTLVAPANNVQNVISDSVFFVWRSVSGAASYNLQVSTVNSTTTYTGITDTTRKVTGLAKLTNYTWKVEALNAGGTSYYTASFAFTTIIAAPAVPSALLPAAAAVNVGRLGPFSWNSTLNATKYRLQIATDNAFATIVTDTTINIDTTCTLKTPLTASTDYYWRINAQNLGGASAYSTGRLFTTGTALDVERITDIIPQEFALFQNYPNPFNPTTTIRYDIPTQAHVKVLIYDVLGQVVANLADGMQMPGKYTTQWNPTGLGTGVYFLRITAQAQDGSGDFTSVRKLLFIK